ncbi:unnamed protein product [Schistosoma mattheei]|uniref:Uncharacterized protein n=1 Tax=Schistosoma mattheei TaxID=31246 RepID=A0A183NGI2_9TREM|nr:unnamed protein product [Schistosoma mattheei]
MKIARKYSKTEGPAKDKEGEPITEIQGHRNNWMEHIEELLSKLAPLNPPDFEAVPTDLSVDVIPPTIEEIRMAIRQLNSG